MKLRALANGFGDEGDSVLMAMANVGPGGCRRMPFHMAMHASVSTEDKNVNYEKKKS